MRFPGDGEGWKALFDCAQLQDTQLASIVAENTPPGGAVNCTRKRPRPLPLHTLTQLTDMDSETFHVTENVCGPMTNH